MRSEHWELSHLALSAVPKALHITIEHESVMKKLLKSKNRVLCIFNALNRSLVLKTWPIAYRDEGIDTLAETQKEIGISIGRIYKQEKSTACAVDETENINLRKRERQKEAKEIPTIQHVWIGAANA